ncbi:hypothetical protein EVAR_78898_1 [Eumeta japonica]|uniref:Uncharacterized protein n=1 Tax=Eumeta variegata TaxID=151549 RepID=A0A4C1U2I0_EUMVA|nr:hypothetical protein EVAR_78898_1 [Eumeta japonica]
MALTTNSSPTNEPPTLTLTHVCAPAAHILFTKTVTADAQAHTIIISRFNGEPVKDIGFGPELTGNLIGFFHSGRRALNLRWNAVEGVITSQALPSEIKRLLQGILVAEWLMSHQ